MNHRRRLLCLLTFLLLSASAAPVAADVVVEVEKPTIDTEAIQDAFTRHDFEEALLLLDGQLELYPWDAWLLGTRFQALLFLNRQEEAAAALTSLASSPEAEPGIVLKNQSRLSGVYGEWRRSLEQYREGSTKYPEPGDEHAIAELERAIRITDVGGRPQVDFAGPVGAVWAATNAVRRSNIGAALDWVDVAGAKTELRARGKKVSSSDLHLFLELMLKMAAAEYLEVHGYEVELVDETDSSATVDVHSVVLIHSTHERIEQLIEDLSRRADRVLARRSPIPLRSVIAGQMRDKWLAAGGPPYERNVSQRVTLQKVDDAWRITDVTFEGHSMREGTLGAISALPFVREKPNNRKLMVVAGVCATVVVVVLILFGYLRRRKSLGEILSEPAPLPQAKLRRR